MTIAGLPDGYCDIAYADLVNTNSDWTGASDEVKEAALQWARVYFDSVYSCIWETIPDEIKTANSMLAEQYVMDSTKFFAVTADTGLTGKEVGAGPLRSKKTFDPIMATRFVDQFPYISALVGAYCTMPNGEMSSAAVVRR